MKKALKGKDNIRFVLVNKKLHNPNYTVEAVQLLQAIIKEKERRVKEGSLQTEEEIEEFISCFDWWKVTEQDEAIWELILNTLAK